jgi:thiamine monophosphate kinase
MEGSVIAVRIEDRSGLADVRRAAWVAHHRNAALEVVIRYRPPSLRVLARWHRDAPAELRWRVTGSVFADGLAADADALARREGVVPEIVLEQVPRRRATSACRSPWRTRR